MLEWKFKPPKIFFNSPSINIYKLTISKSFKNIRNFLKQLHSVFLQWRSFLIHEIKAILFTLITIERIRFGQAKKNLICLCLCEKKTAYTNILFYRRRQLDQCTTAADCSCASNQVAECHHGHCTCHHDSGHHP